MKETEIQLSNATGEITAPNFDKIPSIKDAEAKILKIHKLIDGLKKDGDIVMYKNFNKQTGKVMSQQPFYTLPLTNKIWLALDFKVISENAERIVETLDNKASITYNFRTLIKSHYGFEGVGFGACSSNEKGKGIWDEQQLSGTAQTRSQVRALRSALRISECSIEEITNNDNLNENDIKGLDENRIRIENVYADFKKLLEDHERPKLELNEILDQKEIDIENYCFETYDKLKRLYDISQQRLESKPAEKKEDKEPIKYIKDNLGNFHGRISEAFRRHKGDKTNYYDSDEYKQNLKVFYKVGSVKEMTKSQFDTEMDRLQDIIKRNAKELDDDLPF